MFRTLWLAGGGFTTADWTAESDQAEAEFGFSVSTAGDVNGDGFADVVVGAPFYDGAEIGAGRVSVYLGSADGLGASPAWTVESDQASAWLGYSVGGGGDVDGDGFDDIVAAAPLYNGAVHDGGQALVWRGSAYGFAVHLDPAWTVEGNANPADQRWFVAIAGDVNADGLADVAIGRPGIVPGADGQVVVHHGSTAGPEIDASWVAVGDPQDGGYEWLGSSVASAGDVNGDGFDDLIAGAIGWHDDGAVEEGTACVWLGSYTGLAAVPAWSAESDHNYARLGAAVASAGDVNDDGFGDVIVSAPYFDNPEVDEGRVYLHLGSPAGPDSLPAWTFEANDDEEEVGTSLASAGDLNLDGFDDVIVGAPNWSVSVGEDGAGLVFLGTASGLEATATFVVGSGQVDANLGFAVAAAGDVDCDGAPDILAGAPLYQNGELDEGRAFLFGGAGESAGVDTDGDGTLNCSDCDPEDPGVHPGGPEICDGLDSDCSGGVPVDELDLDGDGVIPCAGDCDDADPSRPRAESCNGLDDDCDGALGPDELNVDGDRFMACQGDCDDADPEAGLDLVERCGDAVDNDCDGAIDESDGLTGDACGRETAGCSCGGTRPTPGSPVHSVVAILASLMARRAATRRVLDHAQGGT